MVHVGPAGRDYAALVRLPLARVDAHRDGAGREDVIFHVFFAAPRATSGGVTQRRNIGVLTNRSSQKATREGTHLASA